METWKDIKGFEGMYQISSLGKVRSLDRIEELRHSSGTEYKRLKKGKELTPEKGLRVEPYVVYYLKKNGKRYMKKAHRLVALAFIENNENKKVVNHKDCNPKNNAVENLEWCTHQENIKHAYDNGRIDLSKAVESSVKNRYKRFKKVYQYTMNNEFIREFESVKSAANHIGVDQSSLARACRGAYSNSKNYIWSYVILH